MKCEEVQKQTPEYLEDMLPEPSWLMVRSHFSECGNCRNHAARLSSLAGDLKQLAKAPLPFDLTQAVLQGLSRENTPLGNSFNGAFLIGGALIAVLCFGIYFTVSNSSKPQTAQSVPDAKQEPLPYEQAAILENLKQTEEQLARVGRPAGSKRLSVASLEPFRWYLKFPSVSEQQVFTEKVKTMKREILFEEDYFLALTMDQDVFEKLIPLMNESSATVMEGPQGDLSRLPLSQTPLRVLLLMEVHGGGSTPPWFQLRFLRRNSYFFARKLHETGFEFLYESSQFILLKVSSEKFIQLRAEMQDMLGLQIVAGKENDPLQEASGEFFPVILFLQEG